MLTKSTQPTFLLKNIIPNELYNKYKAGYFNRPVPEKIKLTSINDSLKSIHPEQKYQAVKFIVTNTANVEKFITNRQTNQTSQTSKDSQNTCGGRCDYCKQDFEHQSVGYPIAYEPKQHLKSDNTYHIDHLFWVEGACCSYECCLAFVKMFKIHALTHDCEILLKLMYKLEYKTDDVLTEAVDFRLLDKNGGPLTLEEWKCKLYKYVRTNNVIKIPVQAIYAKQAI